MQSPGSHPRDSDFVSLRWDQKIPPLGRSDTDDVCLFLLHPFLLRYLEWYFLDPVPRFQSHLTMRLFYR